MPIINIKRIFQPSLVQNDKEQNLSIHQLTRQDAQSLLLTPITGGAVFGIESHWKEGNRHMNLFGPFYMKSKLEEGSRSMIFDQLPQLKKNLSIMQLYTQKTSMFPVKMDYPSSFLSEVEQLCPPYIDLFYQLLVAYRQDRWKERIHSQYTHYLEGVENPSERSLLLQTQYKLNESLNRFLGWEWKHHPIEEVPQKLEENGFRTNIRLGLIGGSRLERRTLFRKIKGILDEMGYANNWGAQTFFTFDDIIKNIKKRKFNNIGKHDILSVSELLPFLMTESVVHVQAPPIGVSEITRRNSPFHVLPLGSKKKQQDGTEIAKKFIHALNELGKVKEEMVAKRTQAGPTMMKVTFDLPKGLRLSDLTKKSMVEDIQTYMGIKHLQILQGEEVGEVDVMLPQEKRQTVFLREYVDTADFLSFAELNPLPIFVGVDEIGIPIYKCLTKIRHILVAGTTGSGKSVWMNQLILTLLLMRSQEEMHMYMIDVKQVEFPIYEDFPQVQQVITDAKESIQLLRRLIAEMDKRYSLFKEADVKNIALYNKKNPKDKIPYLVCVIDEYAELALRVPEVHDLIQSMSQLARAAGIHLIIATQDPRVEVIPGIIKSNLPGKIGFRCSNANSYLTFLNTKPPFNLLGNGDGTMSFEGQMDEHIRFQGCLIIDDPHNDDLEAELIKRIAKGMSGEKTDSLPEVIEEPVLSEKDRVKQIIARTGETRITHIRDIMRVNINRLKNVMQELIEEGFLEAGESKQEGYKLVASEEELEKWRE